MSARAADLTEAIGRAMGEVLGVGRLDPEADFFDCGGDSLRAVEVLQSLAGEQGMLAEELRGSPEAAEALRATLLETFFEDATPRRLAAVVAGHLPVSADGEDAALDEPHRADRLT